MTATDLIADLRQRGLRLRPNGDKLRIEGPARLLTPDLRERLTQAKTEILAALKHEDAPGTCGACRGTNFWFSVHGAVVCWRCHPPAVLDLVNWWTL